MDCVCFFCLRRNFNVNINIYTYNLCCRVISFKRFCGVQFPTIVFVEFSKIRSEIVRRYFDYIQKCGQNEFLQ